MRVMRRLPVLVTQISLAHLGRIWRRMGSYHSRLLRDLRLAHISLNKTKIFVFLSTLKQERGYKENVEICQERKNM